jgi:hypothetical protein
MLGRIGRREQAQAQALQHAIAAEQWAAEQARHLDALAETKRHNVEVEKRPPANIYLPGEGGYVVAPSRGEATGKLVRDDQGNPVLRAKPQRVIAPAEKAQLEAMTLEAAGTQDLLNRFKPEYAGEGALAPLSTQVSQALGSWAPQSEQDKAQFWADFARIVELPERNRIFGASLSPGEAKSWEGAKNIKRSTDPKVVRQKLAELSDIYNRKIAARREALIAEGYDKDAVEALTRTRPVQSSDEDQQAIDWARAQLQTDPTNAKAKHILQLHGIGDVNL